MKILVTGVAGFIGFHTANRLISEDIQVLGIDNLNDYYDVDLKNARLAEIINRKNFTFKKIDFAERNAIDELFKEENFTHVIHLGAQAGVRYSIENPQTYIDSNITGFLNILEASKNYQIEHLVYASSSSVYGLNKNNKFKIDDPTSTQISMYAASKKSNEVMAHVYSNLFNLPTTGLRFFTVYGPWGRPDMAPIIFANAISNNQSINIFNYGNHERDFTYIDDIVDGIINSINIVPKTDLLDNKIPFRIYNLGNGKPIKLMTFINLLETNLHKEAKKNMLPMQEGDVERTSADITVSTKNLNYRPSTSIEDGVGLFIEWYKKYYEEI